MENKKVSEIFSQVYHNNLWGGADSLSGPGSNLIQTKVIRKEIPELIKKYSVKKMLDVPCGDFFWMKEIKDELAALLSSYTGGDIVADIIDNNNRQYHDGKFSFKVIDITKDSLSNVDLIFTRDCFIHLSYSNIYKAIKNYKRSGSQYLLVSTYIQSSRRNYNVDGFYVHGRMLNMEKFPFYFPPPKELIVEGCTEGNGEFADKSLGLWKLSDLHLSRMRLLIIPSVIFWALIKILKKGKSLIRNL